MCRGYSGDIGPNPVEELLPSKTALTSLSLQCQRELGKLKNDGEALLFVRKQSFAHQSCGMLEEKAWGSCPDAAC